MSYYQRKFEIIDLLNSKEGGCSIDLLCKKLYASRSTLRRDLIQMEEEGIIRRHHGGVSLIADSATENPVMLRKLENPDKKSVIARYCRNYIHDNMVIFLDSSSTVSYLCPILKTCKNLTVITNGLNVATMLSNAPGVRVYVCPGLLKNKSLSIIGEYSSHFLDNFRADTFFFSCKGVNKQGIFEGDDFQALTKRCMLKNADKKILLCDSTKEFSEGYFKLTSFRDIDLLISDSPFTNDVMDVIREAGTSLIPQ